MFCLLCAVVLCFVCVNKRDKTIFEHQFLSQNVAYCLYTNDNIKIDDDITITDNGASKMIVCDPQKVTKIKNELSNIYGESVTIYNANDADMAYINKICKTKIFQETFDNLIIFYCYDARLSKFVTIDGKKINMQVAISNDNITIGYPIILGEY